MSLYGMMFGKSAASAELLAMLGLTEGDFYRFRDCYLTDKGEIAVYTRGGGGNRECYCDFYGKEEPEKGPAYVRSVDLDGDGFLHFPGCVSVVHAKNESHPCYLRNEDDDFDSTYATFYFRIPETADREKLAEIQPEIARNDAWVIALEALRQSNTPAKT